MKQPIRVIVVVAVCLLARLQQPTQAQEELRRYLPRSLVAAFREVTKETTKSTVQVYCDGYRACLGAIVRADGHIVTKASELKGKIEVQLASDARKHEAKVIARDAATDLAILKIDAKDLPVVAWNGNATLPVGSWLATPGIVPDPISIGVVSVTARKILPPKAALGVRLADEIAQITSVEPGFAADKAGIKEGDIVRQLNGEDIKDRKHLQDKIGSQQPGDKVKLVIQREGKLQTIEATLGSMNELVRDERSEFQNSLGGELSGRRTGFPLAIQHDSVLLPRECGGPIVDLEGKVVGLNIARAGRVESYALPASLVRETVDKLLQTELTSTSSLENKSPGRGRER